MPKGLLLAAMDFSAAPEDEFHDWYDLEHIPERDEMLRLHEGARTEAATRDALTNLRAKPSAHRRLLSSFRQKPRSYSFSPFSMI